ncbi:helix-turn-helix domain-containing protein [bacterium]|nr:helix-turn-helix domain-containing protein [bacterium]
MKDLLTARETASLFKISLTNLYQLTSKKKIPYIKKPGIGLRFDREALEAWIGEGEVKPI